MPIAYSPIEIEICLIDLDGKYMYIDHCIHLHNYFYPGNIAYLHWQSLGLCSPNTKKQTNSFSPLLRFLSFTFLLCTFFFDVSFSIAVSFASAVCLFFLPSLYSWKIKSGDKQNHFEWLIFMCIFFCLLLLVCNYFDRLENGTISFGNSRLKKFWHIP